MASLSQSDLQEVLAFLGTCESFPDVESLRWGMLAPLAEVVPYDTAAYHEVNVHTGETSWIIEPADSMARADHDAFVRWGRQHPIVQYHATHTSHAVKLTDFLNRRELHSLELYDEFFAPLEIEHQIVIGVPKPAPVIVGLPLNRRRRDFTERERALLDLLRPELARVFRRVQARTQARRALEHLEAAAERGGRAVVLLGRNGRVQSASGAAMARLHDWFSGNGDGPGALPDAVVDWLHAAPRSPLVAAHDGVRLTVTHLPGAAEGEADALLLEEERFGLARSALAALGLTRREAQVLCLADRGLTNDQIAAEISVSTRTVGKHLEHVYAKLCVPGRTAALAKARAVAA
jgi:DNA-binding CsgD family transcriptional regulator